MFLTNLFSEFGLFVVTEEFCVNVVGVGDGLEGRLDVLADVGRGLHAVGVVLGAFNQIVNLKQKE